ncbi:MAG: hypothetical protein ACI3V0_11215 [Faecousia sp.]
MTLMRFLLEYTIENICHGNRSECARRMGLEYAELRRFRKRINDGGSSNRVTEALLEMYWRENLSVDKVLKAYSDTYFGSDLEKTEAICSELVRSARDLMEIDRQDAQDTVRLLRAASNFFEELETVFCNKKCQKCNYQSEPCPTRRFLEYLKWMRQQLQDQDLETDTDEQKEAGI